MRPLYIWNPQDGFGVCVCFFPRRHGGRGLWWYERTWGKVSINHTSLSAISHAYMYECHQDCTQVTHSVLCHFEVIAWKGGFVCLCGRVKRARVSAERSRWAPGLVPFPLRIHKHHVFLLCKRIQGIGGAVPTIESKGLGDNLPIQGQRRLILVWWSTRHGL